jgi:putative restriction endonuclease
MPFWYLKNDGVWFIADAEKLERRPGRSDPKRSELRQHNPIGGLLPEIARALQEDPSLRRDVVAELLQRNFPDSVHEDLLAAVGLDSAEQPMAGPRRDPDFRAKVLRAYGHRCAICGYDLKLGAIDLALEAAHIKWHQAGGPSTESNGLALCALHHKTFDRGAFSISDDLRVLVSQDVYGTSRAGEWFLAFHGGRILSPQSPSYLPKKEYLCWHRAEVFRAPARRLAETPDRDYA